MAENPLDVIHEQIVTLSRLIRVRANEVYGGHSFTVYAILTFIARSECAHASDFAKEYGMDKATVSRNVSDLIQTGLIERVPDPDHSRMQKLLLSAEGVRALRDIHRGQMSQLEDDLASWPTDQVELFSSLLKRFVMNEGWPVGSTRGGKA